MRPERSGQGNIHRVTPACDRDSADARRIMPGVESEPAPVQIDFEPGIIILWRGIRRHPDIAKESIAITGRNIHAAAEGDREMGKIAADTLALFEGFVGGAGCAGIL